MTLPTALQPLNTHRQFITYITRPSSRPGKMDKIPTDWRTGDPANAHDPAIWTDYDTAFACGGGRVGFVFTGQDPFWFLDIDEALLPDNTWSPLAQELCASFPGAAIEVSISGRGLHIFGTGQVPKHSTRGPGGLELYHTGRFVALGNRPGTTGSCVTDCTAQLAAVVAKYFAKSDPDAPPAEWTNGPREDWRGPTEDAELIRRACQSKSIAGVFGSRATFQQLWDGDVAALAKAYPDPARPYDASSADAALVQHLAFWTGNDCERIKRLMGGSKLARDKWDREDYLPRTILSAVARQTKVCQDKPLEAPVARREMVDREGETYLQPEHQKILFDGCTYIMDSHAILMPGGHMVNEGRFNAMLGGYSFVIDRANAKLAKSQWDAFHNSRDVRYPKVHSAEFAPARAQGEIWHSGNRSFVNTYFPVKTECKKGNAKPFLDHLVKLLPIERDRAIVLAYMAAVVQYPGVKFQWTPLIQGVEGNGKSMLSRCVAQAVGAQYSHWPVAGEITEKFNGWIEGKLFIAVEDIYVPNERQDVIEVLKPMITNDQLEIRGMGREKVTKAICANFILNSNHKDAIRKTRNDRRFAVFYTAQQSEGHIKRDGMGGSYFPDLYRWLKREGYAIVNDYLRGYQIPDELNPAGDCHRAPETSSTEAAIVESAGRMEQELQAAIEQDRVGFRGGWISSHFLDLLIREAGADRQYSRNKRRDMLIEMGYMIHPGLVNGQVNNSVSPDGCKPRLWIMHGHPDENLKGAAVAARYSEDQTDKAVLRAVA
jgi:hypothetical protein